MDTGNVSPRVTLDILDEIVAESTAQDPSFPRLLEAVRVIVRAASHCASSQSLPRMPGSSALATRAGIGSSATTWRTSVVFPTCRGPATTWMNRRGSRNRSRSVAKAGRRNAGTGAGLLNMLS